MRGKNKDSIETKFMDASKGIGVNSRFGTPSAPVGSTVQTSAMGSSTAKGRLSAIDWKLKVAIALLILAFVATAASRLLKNKKGKGTASSAVTGPPNEEKKGGKEKDTK